jgi:ABC-type uncharacterized transport system ATPase subunit
VAEGTVAELKARVAASVLSVRLADPGDAGAASEALDGLGEAPRIDRASGELRFAVPEPAASAEALRRLDARRVRVAALELHPPSLDDLFLALTGHGVEREAA